MIKNIMIGVLALIAIVLAVAGFGPSENIETLGNKTASFWDTSEGYKVDGTFVIDGSGNVDAPITSTTGTFSGALTANEGFTQGAGVLQFTATSTQAARTLTESELITNSVIEIVGTSSPALTLTLPATSTMTTLLPNAGDYRTWFFTNKHAAATTTTFAAGTGIILDEPDGQNVVIAGGNRAKIECFRDITTDVVCSVDERIDAD